MPTAERADSFGVRSDKGFRHRPIDKDACRTQRRAVSSKYRMSWKRFITDVTMMLIFVGVSRSICNCRRANEIILRSKSTSNN